MLGFASHIIQLDHPALPQGHGHEDREPTKEESRTAADDDGALERHVDVLYKDAPHFVGVAIPRRRA